MGWKSVAVVGGGGAFSGASVTKSANQTGIVSSADVTWNTTHFDTDSYFDDANDQFVIPADGYYLVVAHLQYNNTSGDNTFAFVVTSAQSNPPGGRFGRDSVGQAFPAFEGSQILLLDAADTISVRAFGDASFDVRGSSEESWFQIVSLGS